MVSNDPDTTVRALKERLCAVTLGPYRAEYINDAGPYLGVESEHLAVLERDGRIVQVVDVDSEFFRSLVEYYGASGETERYPMA